MKIYRLEVAGTNKGPFSCSTDCPEEWKRSHFPPHDERNISYDTYEKWLKTYYPGEYMFPAEFYFGFVTLAHLTLAFDGWEKLEDYVLMECEVDTTDNKDFFVLKDGQVMYTKLLSKTDITDQFRTKEKEMKEDVSRKFTFNLVSPTEVRKTMVKEIQRHLEGFTQYLQHQVNKGFRDAAYRNDLSFTIKLNCTLMAHKCRFDQVVETFCKEMLTEGWVVKVTMDEHKYTLEVSDNVPF